MSAEYAQEVGTRESSFQTISERLSEGLARVHQAEDRVSRLVELTCQADTDSLKVAAIHQTDAPPLAAGGHVATFERIANDLWSTINRVMEKVEVLERHI